MTGEVEDLREHLQRYRAVTLQFLDVIPEDRLAWRPRPDGFTAAQHLLHIVQTEDFYIHGLFTGVWETARMRLVDVGLTTAALRARFDAVRAVTLAHLSSLDPRR